MSHITLPDGTIKTRQPKQKKHTLRFEMRLTPDVQQALTAIAKGTKESKVVAALIVEAAKKLAELPK